MRRGVARHHPRLPRPHPPARSAAPGLRRVARRHQGQQHRPGRAHLWTQSQRLSQNARVDPADGVSAHRPLELQPLSRPRRLQRQLCLPQRSGQRALPRVDAGVRRVVYRRHAGVREGAGFPKGEREAGPDGGAASAPGQCAQSARLRAAGEPGAGRARTRRTRVHPRLYRRLPRRGAARLGRSADLVHGCDDGADGGADVDPAALSAAAGDQTRPHDVERLYVAHPAPAHRVFQPALRRRDRLARPGQRPRRPTALGRTGDDVAERVHGPVLPGRDGDVRRRPDRDHGRDGADQCPRAGVRVPQAKRCQPPIAPGDRQAYGHDDERAGDDGEPQSGRRRRRVLRQVDRLLRQNGQCRARTRRDDADHRRPAGAADGANDGGRLVGR